MGPYFGLYRGVVTATEDPAGRGRIQISAPEIGEDFFAWAALSMPVGGAAAAAPAAGRPGVDPVRAWQR